MTLANKASACLLPLLLWGAPAPAGIDFPMDPERPGRHDLPEPVERKELPVPLAPWPRDQDLIPFVPDGPPKPFKYFIDSKNLHVDAADSVVRYTLVIESANGVRNLSQEGIRCTLKGAYKVYAYGGDGRFTPAPATDWQPITMGGADAYREDLFRYRFCIPRETRAQPLKDVLRALRERVRVNSSQGFQTN